MMLYGHKLYCDKLSILKITGCQRGTILSLCTRTIRTKKKATQSKNDTHRSEISRIFPGGSCKVDPYQTGLMKVYLTILKYSACFILMEMGQRIKTQENLTLILLPHACKFFSKLFSEEDPNTCKIRNYYATLDMVTCSNNFNNMPFDTL